MVESKKAKLSKLLECFGLIILFIAALWQFFITDWINEQYLESHNRIMRETFYDILESQEDLAYIVTKSSKDQKIKLANKVSKRNGNRIKKIIEMRDDRNEVWREKTDRHFYLGLILFSIASIIIILAKYLEVRLIKVKKN